MQMTRWILRGGFGCLFMLFFSHSFAQTITGRVFRDYNTNGVFDSTATLRENGQTAVRVKAFNRLGGQVAATTTDYWGNYNLNVGSGDSFRVEFDSLPAFDFPSNAGLNNGSTIQFVTGGATDVSLGINYPAHFSQDTPYLVTPCYVNGAVGATGVNDVLVHWNYYNVNTTTTDKRVLATKAQIGSTWGVAYARSTKQLFTSTFIKRHCGLPDFNRDSLGDAGNIFLTDLTTPSVPNTSLWLDLTSLGLDFGSIGTDWSRSLRAPNFPSQDPTAVAKVGKMGIGGIDLSDDETTLFVTNLWTKQIHLIRTSDKSLRTTLNIPNPNCTGGDTRPFALKFYKGKLYVGVVCDAQSSQDSSHLQAFVYAYDGNSFAQVLNFPLNYARQIYFKNALYSKFLPWRDVFDGGRQPFSATIAVDMQPILADIEFDPNGDGMILALLDRYGHIGGSANYDDDNLSSRSVLSPGDILYAYKSGDNQWTIESGGDKDGTGPFTPRLDQTTQLVDRRNNATEFFRDDMFTNGNNTVAHREILAGGLAVLAAHNRVDFVALDPLDISFTGGTKRLNCYDGRYQSAYQIYQTPNNNPQTFSKANGLGDLELISVAAPIEIGNRVWRDDNQNGIQDAHEPALSGVTVELRNGANQALIATAVTNAKGNYYFSSTSRSDTTNVSFKYNLPLQYQTNYQLRIARATGTNQQTPLQALALTLNQIGSSRLIDNDATLQGNAAIINFTTGAAGENNHSFDFGFAPSSCIRTICLPVVVTRN
jgi:hypothetical protein